MAPAVGVDDAVVVGSGVMVAVWDVSVVGVGAVDGLASATGDADVCGPSLGIGVDPHAATAIRSRLAIAGRRIDRTTGTSDRVLV
jgi:hypothetical protein